jgi:hypothetical protein
MRASVYRKPHVVERNDSLVQCRNQADRVETGEMRLASTFIGLRTVLPTAAVPQRSVGTIAPGGTCGGGSPWRPSLTEGAGDNNARHRVTSASPSSDQQI